MIARSTAGNTCLVAQTGEMSSFFLERIVPICDSGRMDNGIDIDYVAALARIELSQEEKEKFSAQLGQVLDYFKKLSDVDVEGVEPSAHAHAMYNVWREDVEGDAMSIEDALMNAPKKRDNQIVVPKVVEDA